MLLYLLSLLNDERDKIILTDMYRQYDQLVRRIAGGVLQNQYDAEDAAMAVWVKVINHFDTAKARFGEPQKVFVPWITLVTRNAAIDECRKRKRDPKPIAMRDIPFSADTEKEAVKRMAIELIQSMPDQFRIPLEMRILGEYSFKEIGKAMGCSEKAAEKRFERANKALRKQIREKRGQ